MSDHLTWSWGEPADIEPHITAVKGYARELASVTKIEVATSAGSEVHEVFIDVEPHERVSVKSTTAGFVVLVSRDVSGKRYWWKPWKRRTVTVSRQYPIYTNTEIQ